MNKLVAALLSNDDNGDIGGNRYIDNNYGGIGGNDSQQKLLSIANNLLEYTDWMLFNDTTNNDSDDSIFFSNNNTNLDLQQPSYSPIFKTVELIGHYLTFYYTPILVFTGSIGNILSVIVFFKTKLRKLSSSYYLAALAISDTCFLIGLFVGWLNFIDVDIYHRAFYCQFFTFFSFLCSFCSVWYVVAFTVERFIAVMYPLKRQTMCTVNRAKIVLFGLTVLGILHCLPSLFFASPEYNPKLNITICDIRTEYKKLITFWNYADTIVVFVIPFTAIVVLNTFTGCTVWKFANVRRKMTMQRRRTHGSRFSTSYRLNASMKRKNTVLASCLHPIGSSSTIVRTSSTRNQRKIRNSSQTKVTKMLLIVSSVFVCLNLPSYVMRVYTYLEVDAPKSMIVTQYITWFLFITNFGINFVLYCVSGQNFRKAVISLFRKNKTNQRDGTTQITVSEYIRNSGTRTSRRRLATQNEWRDAHELQELTVQ